MHEIDRAALFPEGRPRVGLIVGTGPSLTIAQLHLAAHLPKFGANLAYRLGVDVALGCNWQFWEHYKDDAAKYVNVAKWTTRPELRGKYPWLHYIEERWEPGLSVDKSWICAHHGSGPQTVNLALHYGCEVMLLVGWDMRYSGKVSDREYLGERHYFGEYPEPLQHWPRTGPNGEMTGLIAEMESIVPSDYGIEIINCTPGSAMRCFPMMPLEEALSRYAR